MNRIDRLFAILLILQRKRRVRAADLARSLEVSERTIYRDMTALSESGVPIIGTPGEGYELVEGYYLPPLMFTPGETTALMLGVQLLQAHSTGAISSDAERALAKVAVALPEPLRRQAEPLARRITFREPLGRFDFEDPHVKTLRQAIEERRVVRMHYHGYNRDETTEREIEPLRLTCTGRAWYVTAHCRLRDNVRGFRLSRIERLQLLPERFEPRPETPRETETLLVRVRVRPGVARWVRERQHYAYVGDEPSADGGWPVMRYRVHSLGEITPWLLGWGADVELLDPPELRNRLREEVRRLARMLEAPPA